MKATAKAAIILRITGPGDDDQELKRFRHCEERSERSSFSFPLWIASPSLSSGAHSRDPLARNGVLFFYRAATFGLP
jgi:hypothetical protein